MIGQDSNPSRDEYIALLSRKIRMKQLAHEFTSQNNELFAYLQQIGLELEQQALNDLAIVAPTDTTNIHKFQLQVGKCRLLFDLLDLVVKDGQAAADELEKMNSPGYSD